MEQRPSAMELVNSGHLNPNFWGGKKVLITGHTGFKGSWLTFWLYLLNAKVVGYSLEPNSEPSLFRLLQIDALVESVIGDINDPVRLRAVMDEHDPDVIFHLAAQPIVSEGYIDPVGTFETNVMGTVRLLEECRRINRNIPVIVVSSDKCYKNLDSGRAFETNDSLGGKDPYSASKAGTEIVTAAYMQSFFSESKTPRLASARAGNVIGGGDWSQNRLLADAARAFSMNNSLIIRNQTATRPWQHVLEPIYGYMLLAQSLSHDRKFCRAWNFGPDHKNHRSVQELAELFANCWDEKASIGYTSHQQNWSEARTLALNCSDTNSELNWNPVLDWETTVEWSASWYKKTYYDNSPRFVRSITMSQIQSYTELQNNRK